MFRYPTGFRCLLAGLLLMLPSRVDAQPRAIAYYRTTNEAELAVCRKDLDSAAALYARAFAINPDKPFTKDLLNAFYCALDRRDFATARKHIRTILRHGVGNGMLPVLFADFHGNEADSIRRWISTFPNDTTLSNNAIRTIRYYDSVDRAGMARLSRKYRRRALPQGLATAAAESGALHAKLLTDLFRSYGVPNETTDGMQLGRGGEPVFQHLAERSLALSDTLNYGLDTVLFRAILSYDYHPDAFLQLRLNGQMLVRDSIAPLRCAGFELSDAAVLRCFFRTPDSTVYPYAPIGPAPAEADVQRRALGLETVDELYIKLRFSNAQRLARGPFSKYNLTHGATMMPGPPNPDKSAVAQLVKEFELYMSKKH